MEKKIYDTSPTPTSNADLVKKLIEEYSSGSSFAFWFLGSACLIAAFLFTQNFSKENVYFPFFTPNKNGVLEMTLEASKSAALQAYGYFGKNKIAFNDLLKLLLLAFILLMLVKTVWSLFILPTIKNIFKVLSLVFPFITKPIQRIINKIPRSFNERKWLAQPEALNVINNRGRQIYPQLRRKIPVEVRNFQYVRFSIHILGNYPHWRAGIFITSYDTSKDYVFHIYKNENDSRILTKMTKRIFAQGHINESDKVLSELMTVDINNILFEIKTVGENMYALNINGQEIDRYSIPKEDFKSIEIGAWADDNPYKIEFENIKFKG